MSSDTYDNSTRDQPPAAVPGTPTPEVVVHNTIKLDGNRGWNIAITLLAVAGVTAIGYQLSLGPLAEVVATGMTIFLTTLVNYMFKAGILNLPEKQDDDLAFTKGTLRRIYDEITAAIVKSSVLRLMLFALAYTVGFLLVRAVIAFGLGLMTSMWMAIGVGLLAGAAVIAQSEIFAWLRKLGNKPESSRS